MSVLHRSSCKHAQRNEEEELAIPLKSPHQFTEIRPPHLQYPLSHPKKSQPRHFSSKCGKTLGYFMSYRSCPPHSVVHCFTFKLHSFPSFSNVSAKYQILGILIPTLPYYSYFLYFLVYMKTYFMTIKLEFLQIHKYF